MSQNQLPWKEAHSVYTTAGPAEAVEFSVAGVEFQVKPATTTGIHTGRGRYFVACVDCDCILHAETTGPSSHIAGHLREKHNFKGELTHAD